MEITEKFQIKKYYVAYLLYIVHEPLEVVDKINRRIINHKFCCNFVITRVIEGIYYYILARIVLHMHSRIGLCCHNFTYNFLIARMARSCRVGIIFYTTCNVNRRVENIQNVHYYCSKSHNVQNIENV